MYFKSQLTSFFFADLSFSLKPRPVDHEVGIHEQIDGPLSNPLILLLIPSDPLDREVLLNLGLVAGEVYGLRKVFVKDRNVVSTVKIVVNKDLPVASNPGRLLGLE